MARFDWTCPECGRTVHGSYPTPEYPTCYDCRWRKWEASHAEREALMDRQAMQVAEYALRRFIAEL